MIKGCFVDVNGKQVYFGRRENKPALEVDHFWHDLSDVGQKPTIPDGSYDDYYLINGNWELQPGANKPSDDQRIDRVFNDSDRMKVLLEVILDQENRLRVLEGKNQITKAQLKAALKGMLEAI